MVSCSTFNSQEMTRVTTKVCLGEQLGKETQNLLIHGQSKQSVAFLLIPCFLNALALLPLQQGSGSHLTPP